MTPKIGQNLAIETEKNIQVLDVLSDETRLFYSSTEHPFYLIQTTGTVNTHPLRSVSVFQFFSYIPSGIGMSSEDVAVKPVPTEEQFNDAIARAKEAGQRDGLFAGLASALTSSVIGGQLMGFNRNKTIFCGLATGIISGYLFTQAFKDTEVARVHAERAKRSRESVEAMLPSFRSK